MSASMQKELPIKTYSMVDLIYSSSGFTEIQLKWTKVDP